MRSASIGVVASILLPLCANAQPNRLIDPASVNLEQQALDQADHIVDPARRIDTYQQLLPIMGRLKNQAAILRLTESALTLAAQSKSRETQAAVSSAIALSYALAGNHDEHDRWMHQAIDAGAWTDRRLAWPEIARARLEGGDHDGATEIASLLKSPSHRAACFADLANIAARQNNRTAAGSFIRLAKAEINADPHPQPAMEKIVASQVQLNDLADAQRTAIMIPIGFERARAMANIARATFQQADQEQYRKLIGEAHLGASKAGGAADQAAALLAVARLQAQAGDAPGARQTLVLVDKSLKGLEPENLIGINLAIAGVLTQLGDADAASASANKAIVLLKGVRGALAGEDFVASMVAAGDLARAITAADAIEEPQIRARANHQIARGLEAAGNTDELIRRAPQLGPHDWHAARITARALTRAGKLNQVLELQAQSRHPEIKCALYTGAAEAKLPR